MDGLFLIACVVGFGCREALATLIQDLSTILSNDWNTSPSEEIKRRINAAIARALDIAI